LQKVVGKYEVPDPQNPSSADKKYLSGLNALDQKNFPSAVEYFTQAVKLSPENCHYYSQLGVALGMFPGRLSEAERYCKKAIELDPDNPDICYNLGFLYQRHNLVEAAQQAFLQAQRAEQKMWEKFFSRQATPIEMPWNPEEQASLEPEAAGETADTTGPETPGFGEDGQEDAGLAAPPSPAEAEPEPKLSEEDHRLPEEPDRELGPEAEAPRLTPEEPIILNQAAPPMESPEPQPESLSPEPAERNDAGPVVSGPEVLAEDEGLGADGQVIMAQVIGGDEEPAPGRPEVKQPEPPTTTAEATSDLAPDQPPAGQGRDMLDELDSLEAVLNGSSTTAGIGSGDGDLLLEMKQHHDIVALPPEKAGASPPAEEQPDEGGGSSLDDLEDEALSLLRELGMDPSPDAAAENVAMETSGRPAAEDDAPAESASEMPHRPSEGPEAEGGAGKDEPGQSGEHLAAEGDAETEPDHEDLEELQKIEEMERKMAEELERLKQEREKLKKRKKK
jgi:hypothetical protein